MAIVTTDQVEKSDGHRTTKSQGTWTPKGIAFGLAIAAVGIVIAYKLYLTDLTTLLGPLSASELLSFVLAFFSIWLSMMFYFKADESSRKFYDDTYKFTMDTSMMLGRIEAGFSEALKHLNESYYKLHDTVHEGFANRREAHEVVVSEENNLEEIVKKNEATIAELSSAVALTEADKERLSAQLRANQNELLHTSRALADAQARAVHLESEFSARSNMQSHIATTEGPFTTNEVHLLRELGDHLRQRYHKVERVSRSNLSEMVANLSSQELKQRLYKAEIWTPTGGLSARAVNYLQRRMREDAARTDPNQG